MYYADNKKEETKITEEIDLLNLVNIRKFGEKENNKYVGISEADTIKQSEMEKIRI